MILSDCVPSICATATLTPPRAVEYKRLEARQLCPEGAFPTYGRAGVGHNLGGVVRPAPDDQVKNAVAINIPHRYIDAAFKTGKWDDGGDKPVTVAVVQTNLAGLPEAPGMATA